MCNFEEELIIVVQEYKVIYDIGDPFYYDIKYKDNAWSEISERLHRTAEECKKKWHQLRDGLRRAKARRKTKSGQEATNWKPWKFEKELSFVDCCNKSRPQKSNILGDSDDNDNDDESYTEDSHSNCVTPSQSAPSPQAVNITAVASPPDPDCSLSQDDTPSLVKRRRKQHLSPGEVLQQYLFSKEEKVKGKEKNKRDDHISKFFSAIEESFRQLPKEYQVSAKAEIFNLVSQYERKVLECEYNYYPGHFHVYPQQAFQPHTTNDPLPMIPLPQQNVPQSLPEQSLYPLASHNKLTIPPQPTYNVPQQPPPPNAVNLQPPMLPARDVTQQPPTPTAVNLKPHMIPPHDVPKPPLPPTAFNLQPPMFPSYDRPQQQPRPTAFNLQPHMLPPNDVPKPPPPPTAVKLQPPMIPYHDRPQQQPPPTSVDLQSPMLFSHNVPQQQMRQPPTPPHHVG